MFAPRQATSYMFPVGRLAGSNPGPTEPRIAHSKHSRAFLARDRHSYRTVKVDRCQEGQSWRRSHRQDYGRFPLRQKRNARAQGISNRGPRRRSRAASGQLSVHAGNCLRQDGLEGRDRVAAQSLHPSDRPARVQCNLQRAHGWTSSARRNALNVFPRPWCVRRNCAELRRHYARKREPYGGADPRYGLSADPQRAPVAERPRRRRNVRTVTQHRGRTGFAAHFSQAQCKARRRNPDDSPRPPIRVAHPQSRPKQKGSARERCL